VLEVILEEPLHEVKRLLPGEAPGNDTVHPRLVPTSPISRR
jgi:hypothetical protein